MSYALESVLLNNSDYTVVLSKVVLIDYRLGTLNFTVAKYKHDNKRMSSLEHKKEKSKMQQY